MASGLGRPEGIFRLDDSDKCVGSFFLRSDVAEIFEVGIEELSCLEFTTIGEQEVIDELELHKAWHNGVIENAQPSKGVSLDELILKAMIKRTFQTCLIEPQVKVGRFKLDLKVSHEDKSVFVEFDGPSHFSISRYGPPKHHPFRKKRIVENETGIEVVNWAYWIQRCESNVRALFDESVEGFGAIWGATILFGGFYFDDSSEIVKAINSRFNAERHGGCGYIYEGNTEGRNKPEHPIINKIKDSNASVDRLLPKGYTDAKAWLPEALC